MADRRLTEAQQQTVAANLGIAGAVAKRYVGRGIDFDELYSLACLAVCYAALSWQPGHGCKFSTYACVSIRNHISNAFKYRNNKQRWRADYAVPIGPDCPALATYDPGPIGPEPEVLWAAIRRLPARERIVLEARLEGRRQHEIGAEIGLERHSVALIEQRARNLLKERLA